jgi:hypothetical protein
MKLKATAMNSTISRRHFLGTMGATAVWVVLALTGVWNGTIARGETITKASGAAASASAHQTSGTQADVLFPFVLPWDDATPSVMNLSEWLPKPAGKFGHVRAGEDGHLYAGKERVRFFGVDLAFSANIPTHTDAEKVAARMAKFGINIVRFHIMDMQRFPEGILARNIRNTRELDPEALDRLDYFTAQLNRNGIYVYLCLLNYRPFNAADGLPPEIEQAGGSPFQRRHVVGFFDEQVLELQKEYARTLLTRRNAYTGRTCAEDPGVAFVEINNENGLIHAWLSKEVDGLPEIFRAELRRQWNDWLRRRYGSTDKLRQAWGGGEQPLGHEALVNGSFARQLEGWTLERHEGAEATAKVVDTAPNSLPGAKSVQIIVAKPGAQSWHVRLEQGGVRVQAGKPCVLSFRAKADKSCQISVSIEQSHEPWHVLGVNRDIGLTTQWRAYRFVLPINETDDQARAIFDPAMLPATCWITAVSLRPGGVMGLGQDERLEGGGAPAFLRMQLDERSAEVQRDWLRFLWETEDRYWQTMYGFLKNELNVKALVIGTVVGCSTPNLMAKMDCVDAHAYWQHPVFPGRPWDSENWIVRNRTMVNERGGTLPELALRRVLGKPFCVTEYGHAAPNTYVSEGHLLRAACASLQDWDYISASRYSHSDKWDLRSIRNHFDINQHPTKMATLIPAAAMFLRGDVQPARQLVCASLDKEQEIDRLRRGNPWELIHAGHVGIASEVSLIHRVAIASDGGSTTLAQGGSKSSSEDRSAHHAGMGVAHAALGPEQVQPPRDRFVSDTNELDWDLRLRDRGVVTVNAAKNKAVIGFGGGKRFDLGGIIIEPGPTMQDGWSVITVTAMEGGFGAPPCRALITATGYVENTRMGWKNPEKSTVGNDWGEAPTMVEGIPARITLPYAASSVEAWPLDSCGQRRAPMAVDMSASGNGVIAIGPKHQTIWYEVIVK